MGNSSIHDHDNLPILVAGGAAAGMKGGRHIRYKDGDAAGESAPHAARPGGGPSGLVRRQQRQDRRALRAGGPVGRWFSEAALKSCGRRHMDWDGSLDSLSWCSAWPARRSRPRKRRSPTRPNSATSALIRKLLDAGADVNATQVDGMTALHWAVYNDDVATARSAGASGRQRQRRESLRRASAVPGLHERQRGHREAPARGWRRRERDASGRRDRPHDGGARGKSRRRARRCLPGAPTPTRVSGAARRPSCGPRPRGTRRSCGPSSKRSRHPRQARVRVHAVVLRRARGSHRRGACAPRGRRRM